MEIYMRFYLALILIIIQQVGFAAICTSKTELAKHLDADERFNQGYHGKNANIYVSCDNRDINEAQDVYLRFYYPVLDHIKIYEIKENGALAFLEDIGDWVPASSRTTNVRKPTFKILLGAHAQKNFKIAVYSEGSLQLNHEFLSSNLFIKAIESEAFILDIYYGIVFGLIGYNLFLFIQTRQIVFILYVFYLLFYSLFMANMDGISHLYLWRNNLWWSNYSTNIFIPIFLAFMIWFSVEFLKVREYWMKFSKICLSLAFCMTIYAILAFFLPYRTTSLIGALLSVITILILIVSGLYASTKHVVARYYTVAWSCLFLGLLIIVMRNLGVISGSILVDYAMHIGSGSEAILLSLGLGAYIRRVENEKIILEKKADELTIVSQTMQMIAHDVRKPFTIMANTMDVLAHAKPENIRQLANEFLPDVKRTLKEVNGLFDDVIAIGDDHKLNISDQSVYQLIKQSLIKNAISGLDIELKYQLKHTHMLSVDINKVTRIFSNIVENAVQAQDGGHIWFTSSEDDKWITIIVGNSGSFIPEIDRKKVFDMFFTKGKSKGTGLGLAIAEKFVKIHGGKIACQSKENYGTEFTITLPKSSQIDTFETMPSKLNEGSIFSPKMLVQPEDNSHIETLTDKIVQGQPVRILILDDEVIYQKLLLELVPHKIRDFVVIDFCSDVIQARELFQQVSYDLMIIDFDLGKNQISGFDFLEEVKSGSFLKVIHTNRSESSFSKTSYEKGADYFLSKPMTSSHFVKFIYEVSTRKINRSMDLIIIDDEQEYLRPAIMLLKSEYNIRTFESVDALLDELDKKNSAIDLSKVAYIFVDRFIGRFDITKQNVPDNLRKYGYLNKIILFSNSVSDDSDLPKGFDRMISKELSALRDLTGI